MKPASHLRRVDLYARARDLMADIEWNDGACEEDKRKAHKDGGHYVGTEELLDVAYGVLYDIRAILGATK